MCPLIRIVGYVVFTQPSHRYGGMRRGRLFVCVWRFGLHVLRESVGVCHS